MQETVASIEAIIAKEQPPCERLQQVMQAIQDRHPHYEWVGIYVLRGEALELGPYVGAATEHTRIPVGVGVCGTAVVEGSNQLIADVRELSNYLACSATVRSEIVVLIREDERILGQIDADCDKVGAFTEADERFLAEVARVIAPVVGEI